MALINARLESRSQRPKMELTRDLAEANLVKEVYVLRNIVANLQQMLCEVCTQIYICVQTFLLPIHNLAILDVVFQ